MAARETFVENIRNRVTDSVGDLSYIDLDNVTDSRHMKAAEAIRQIADALYGTDIEARARFVDAVVGISVTAIEATSPAQS